MESEIEGAGYQWIGIAPDTVSGMQATKAKYGIRARFLSDAKMTAAQAFRIAYEVDESAVAQLAKSGIDLEAASGESHHQLPIPAVYIVDTRGRIQFAYTNPDYKVRLDPKLLMMALQGR
jgi:Peroxiredoxin